MKIKLKAKRISTTATMPIYSTDRAACADIYCDLRVDKCCELNPNADYKHMEVNTDCFQQLYIAPHETVKIPTGWAFQPESGYMLQLLQRSGLASKGLICVGGILDEDYNSEVIVILLNTTDNYISINNQDRIAQMAIRQYDQADFIEVEKLDETERGGNGFGSTGR